MCLVYQLRGTPVDAAPSPGGRSRDSIGVMVALGVLLCINAAFNALVWPQFFKRVVADPRARDEQGKATKFLTVHVYLIAVALVLALVSLIAGIAAFTGAL